MKLKTQSTQRLVLGKEESKIFFLPTIYSRMADTLSSYATMEEMDMKIGIWGGEILQIFKINFGWLTLASGGS